MANLDITIKRKNGAGYDVLYPTTIIAQVEGLQTALDGKVNTTAVGAANGVASLDASGKVPVGQLPNSVFDSLNFYGTLAGNATNADIHTALTGAVTAAASAGRSVVGYYWVISSVAGTLTDVTGINNGTATYISTVAQHVEGGITTGSTGLLEVGDWVVITGFSGAGTLGSPYTFELSPINNTYEDAGTSIKGIVQLSSNTGAGASTAVTGNNVVTDSVINSLVTTTVGTANKLMAAAHNHDSAYLGISANAVSASKWATARTITLNGDTTGSVSIDGSANVTLTVAVVDDSHNHIISNVDGLQTALDAKVDANTAITAGTATKITYDAKGLVTSGTTLAATDIPSLDASKITTGTFAIGRIPTGTTSTTVSLGNHTHAFSEITSKPTTIAGYGITDAYTETEVDTLISNTIANRPEIYYNASANSDGDLVLDLDSDGAVA